MSIDTLNLNTAQRRLFDEAVKLLDDNFAPPLLWGAAKLSSWYAVALLARQQLNDVKRANALIHNLLTQQDLDKGFEQNYGSFRKGIFQPLSSGVMPLWVTEIYDSYDPNNALFVVMAGIMIDSLYADLVEPDLMDRFRKAMHVATRGNIPRKSGFHGDDMGPCYSNPFLMRCLCSSYIGQIMGDDELYELSESWTKECVALWEEHDSPGEFNSPTYAGITLMALGAAQYCKPESAIAQAAPKLILSVWRSLSESYNPTLLNVAGPWDRGYGFCMTQYFASIGPPIAAVTGLDVPSPMPHAIDGSPHYTDAALIPMQMIVAPYVERDITPDLARKFVELEPHVYKPVSIFPPHDKVPREYSFYVGKGLSVGGITFDEDQVGGPKGAIEQFNPAVIQWDSGDHGGGVGWISMWPTNSCCRIEATAESLTIAYPKPRHFDTAEHNSSTQIILHIGCLPFLQLTGESFTTDRESLPGLDITLGGNVAQHAKRTLTFDKSHKLHGAWHYRLVFDFGASEALATRAEEPCLVLGLRQTQPPASPFVSCP